LVGAYQELDAMLERLRAEDLSASSPEQLATTLVALRARLDRLELEWTRRVGAFDHAEGRHLEGHSSTTAFLKHRCKMAAGRAQRAVSLSQRLPALQYCEKAFSAGEIGLDQLRLVASLPERLDPDLAGDEVSLVNALSELSVAQTRRLLDYWQSAADGPGTEAGAAELENRRYFSLSQTFEGMMKGDFLLDPAAGEVVLTALSALTPPRREGEERTPGQRRADALVDLARAVLDSGVAPGKEKPQVLVLTDLAALCGHGGGTHETVGGAVLTPEQVRRYACDCALSRVVFGADGQPLDVGRSTRTVPPALARAVIARDRHCQHPGCDRPARWCDIHHLFHWADGGPTAIWNLILLCRYHHTLVHRRKSRGEESERTLPPALPPRTGPPGDGDHRPPPPYHPRR